MLHGRDVLYVIEERAPGRPLLVTDVGVRLPATLTASGLAMLAQLPAAQVRALFPHRDTLVQRDGHGPTSVSELRRELTEVRTRGYALEDDSVSAGLSSVARAVLDHTGHPVAGRGADLPARRGRRGGAELDSSPPCPGPPPRCPPGSAGSADFGPRAARLVRAAAEGVRP